MVFVGIDPGKTGGLVALHPTCGIRLFKGEEALGIGYDNAVAVIEKQQAVFLKSGANGRASFSLGVNYGRWLQWMEGHGIPARIVGPRTWQKVMLKDHDYKGKTKDVALQVARALHPGEKITKAIADAVCIAHYCKQLKW